MIIGLVSTAIFIYLAVTSVQKLMDTQSNVDYWNAQVPIEHAYYKSHGCTFSEATKTFTCPIGVPDWVPSPRN